MDVAKLEKMKVVDLRNELQARGLDTKGVKAVLIERLRAFIEGGDAGAGAAPGTPGTPGRRSRRTRSMTRSPSPSPVKQTEPALETLDEEPQTNEQIETEEHEAKMHEDEEEEEAEAADIADEEGGAEMEGDEQIEEQGDGDVELNEEAGSEGPADAEEEQDSQPASNAPEEPMIQEEAKADEVTEEEQKETVEAAEEETEKQLENKEDEAPKTEPESKKRSLSRSRSRSHSKERRDRSRSRSRSKSRTRSRSPRRRSGAGSQSSPSKAAEEVANLEDEPTIEDKQFGLSWYDSDLHLRIDPVTFTSAKPMTHEIYSLVWSGARTNYGVREGKVCYEVRLAEETQMARDHQFRDEPHTRGFRVGFSMPDSTLLLGEAEHSFAYCETGRKALNSEFIDYGKPYQLDDVIGCYLDLESSPCTIKYTLNGEDLGAAFEFDKDILGEEGALFPHIVTKGYEFHVNFADNDNLLVNVERPKRMRRKPRKEKPIEKENDKETLTDSNQENWKVVDEAKADEEEEKGEEEEEANKEKETAKETTEEGDVEMKEEKENIEDNETAEKKPEETVEDTPEKDQKDAAVEESDKTTENGQEAPSSETKPSAATESDEAKNEEDGPSPNKRQKLDDDKHDNAPSEDEYEEIIPEPREPMSLLPGYELIALIPEEKYVPGPQRPESRKECEVILLVGLPGAGKTHWTLNHIQENPDKRYHVIGADALISKMTIDGATRKSLHKGRWERVHELCINSLSSLEEIATKRRRNFILDQTNAYASAQRRKMKGFSDFKRIAVVCIPNDEELKRRNADKTEKGNAYSIRESTLNNLRANFTLPSLEFGWFDDIIYTDLSGDEAKEEVKKYNEKGKKALDANSSKRYRRDHYQRDDRRHNDGSGRRDFNRWNDRRGGHPGGGGGGGGGNRWGGGGGGGGGYRSGWRDERGYGGGGGGGGGGGRGYDNRNNRYSNGPQNWMQNNNRGNRYDDRYNRSGGGGGGGGGGGAGRYDSGGRYDAYGGGGGGGGGRDYRDRDRDRNAGGGGGRRDNYRSGGGGGNQRDFRPGHRDNRTEDSRGGYERSTASKYGSNEVQYGQYNSGGGVGKMPGVAAAGGKASNQGGGKWGTYAQHQAHQQQQQHQHHAANAGNWQQQHHQQYQQQQQQPAAHQQQYWGYNDMQAGYGNQQQQQQWQSADPSQQQEWMSWWQQQGNAQQQQGVAATDANQYWSQYAYQTQATLTGNGGNTDAVAKK